VAGEALGVAGVEPVTANLADPEALRAAMVGADAVVHTAFPTASDASAVETTGVRAMLDAIGDRPFLYTSGIGVVGDTGDRPVGEDDPVHPPAGMRWRRELELATLDAPHGLVLRPGLVYGRAGGLVVTGMINAAIRSGVSRYVLPGVTSWPNVHIDDVGELAALALEAAAGGAVLHAVAGESTPRDVAEAIGRLIGRPEATAGLPPDQARGVVPFADWLGANQRVTAGQSRALGWEPNGMPLTQEIEAGSYRSLLP
jgi:nucleoside-diphosphate-sugar epimerase